MNRAQWDVHWYGIYEAVREGGAGVDGATKEEAWEIADRETVEQFGPRPEEAA